MIVLDMEWNSGYDKIRLDEVLQIGAVRIDCLGGNIIDMFSVFIRPCVHQTLNHPAKVLPELQASLDSTLDFSTAFQAFQAWCGEDREFVAWGGDDVDILRRNCMFWGVKPLEVSKIYDIQAAFSLTVGSTQDVALSRAAEYCQIPMPFEFHNALYDAVYTAVLSRYIDENVLPLLSLSKKARGFSDRPVLPALPPVSVGPFHSHQSALNGRSSRKARCPQCGSLNWVRKWYFADERQCYGSFRCPEHGKFLSSLTLFPMENGGWSGQLSVPSITSETLLAFDLALKGTEHLCVRTQGKKHGYFRSTKRARKTKRMDKHTLE